MKIVNFFLFVSVINLKILALNNTSIEDEQVKANFFSRMSKKNKLISLFLVSASFVCVVYKIFFQRTPEEFACEFLEKFTSQMGSAREWNFTCKALKTNWGSLIMDKDKFTITINGKTIEWNTPGGPWTINYNSAMKKITLLPCLIN